MSTINLPFSWFAPLGRLLLAWLFLDAGWSKVVAPEITAAFMATAGLPDSSLLAFCVGAFELLTAVLIAIGWHARTAAAALASFTLIATFLYHNYWSAPTEQQFVQQLLFNKNIAVIGGLILLASLGAGRFSVEANRIPRVPAAR